MASTRLQRKARRNKSRAKKKVADIQRLNSKPVIRNVDVEEIKKEFAKNSGKKSEAQAEKAEKPAAKKEDKPVAKKAEKKEEAPKQEAAAEESTGVDVDALLKSVGKADESSKDDLKAITGVGPAFEKKLNEIGLYTYEQISKLTKKDIENLGNLDGASADKINSDDWKGEAKKLMAANKGE